MIICVVNDKIDWNDNFYALVRHFWIYFSCQQQHSNVICIWLSTGNQWLQLDIGPPTLITAVVTKGRGDTGRKQWVTKYRISYSNDSVDWTFYSDSLSLEKKVCTLTTTPKLFEYLLLVGLWNLVWKFIGNLVVALQFEVSSCGNCVEVLATCLNKYELDTPLLSGFEH